MGRPTIEQRTISGITKNIGYVYALVGSPAFIWYPSDNRMNFNFDAAGRLLSVEDEANNYVPLNASYAPNGDLASIWQGAGSQFTGFATDYVYNKRFQPALEYSAYNGSSGTVYLYKRCYDYHQGGGLSITFGGFTCSSTITSPGNNGNAYQIVNKIDDTRTQNFSYDALNRIQQGYSNGTNWGQNFTIDPWGNLTNVSAVTGKTLPGGFNAAPATTKNQLTGYSYDAAGNLLGDGLGHSFTYDAENRIITTAGVSYTYDGDGRRVKKSSGTLYWTGTQSEALSESDLSGNISAEYVFFGSKRVARLDRPSLNVHYFIQDQLGSARMMLTWPLGVSNPTVTTEEDLDYTPYGIAVGGGTLADHYAFTGKERDTESGNDYFGARYYASSMGRFMSPDWSAKQEPVPYSKLDDPQTLNLYAYARNNPLSNVDVDGHETEAEKQAAIAAAAKAQNGSTSYNINTTNVSNMQIFKPGSDKCNEFVADTVKSADGTRPVVDGTGKIPTAAQFADPNVKITGLSAPEPMANAKPGDVIAQDHGAGNNGNEEGHVGIVTALPHDGQPGQTASANANVGGKVTVNDWGFRSPTASPNNGERNGAASPAPVVRHPLGDPQ